MSSMIAWTKRDRLSSSKQLNTFSLQPAPLYNVTGMLFEIETTGRRELPPLVKDAPRKRGSNILPSVDSGVVTL